MMNKYPLVTSYILCYKNFQHIYESINSVLNQDYPNIQLIISDDASGNFPKEEIKDFIKKNKRKNLVSSKILINEKNLGTVKNINRALKEGNGQYFIGMSGDDLFYDTKVMKNIVKRFMTTNVDVICCRRLRCEQNDLRPIRCMPNNNYLNIIEKINSPKRQFRAFAIGQYYEMASGSATYFSKRHFEKWGYFDEKYVLWEDGPFYLQYTREGNLIHTAYDIISTKYRVGGITSQNKHPKLVEDYAKFIHEECYKNIDKFNKNDKRYIKFLYLRANKCKTFSKIKKIIFYLSYIDVVLKKLSYKYFCIISSIIETNRYKKERKT